VLLTFCVELFCFVSLKLLLFLDLVVFLYTVMSDLVVVVVVA